MSFGVVVFVSLATLIVSSTVVIRRLRSNYPELYKSWGNPEFGGLTFDSGWGFVAGFGGLLGYRKAGLDGVTLIWCHLLAFSYWLTWGVVLAGIWGVING